PIIVRSATDPAELLPMLYREHGITSLMVEGGSRVLASFVDSGLWDAARVEVSPQRFGADGTAPAPVLPVMPARTDIVDGNSIHFYSQSPLVDVKNL
ncbi:MAG: dihydrofolate reductase family protein, partial [Muribaculaceae bacterium]|nr:dihydrofolate reductase family protein [Muribaculaceae bacterium]